jgi:hypothetical protein
MEIKILPRYSSYVDNKLIHIEWSGRQTGKTTRLLAEMYRWVDSGNIAIFQTVNRDYFSRNKHENKNIIKVYSAKDLSYKMDSFRGLRLDKNVNVRLFCDEVALLSEPLFDYGGYYTMSEWTSSNREIIDKMFKTSGGRYFTYGMNTNGIDDLSEFRYLISCCKG